MYSAKYTEKEKLLGWIKVLGKKKNKMQKNIQNSKNVEKVAHIKHVKQNQPLYSTNSLSKVDKFVTTEREKIVDFLSILGETKKKMQRNSSSTKLRNSPNIPSSNCSEKVLEQDEETSSLTHEQSDFGDVTNSFIVKKRFKKRRRKRRNRINRRNRKTQEIEIKRKIKLCKKINFTFLPRYRDNPIEKRENERNCCDKLLEQDEETLRKIGNQRLEKMLAKKSGYKSKRFGTKNTVYVQWPEKTSDTLVKKKFEEFGNVVGTKLRTSSKGMKGIIAFDSSKSARTCVSKMNGSIVEGGKVEVQLAKNSF